MGHYGMNYWEVLDTPIQAFWMLNKNIDRLRAETDLRALKNSLAAGSQSKEAIEDHVGELRSEIGTVFVAKPKLDREGLKGLKELSQV